MQADPVNKVDGSSTVGGDFTNGATACAVDPGGVLVETLESNNACNGSTVTVIDTTIFKDGFESPPTLPGNWSAAVTS